MTILSATLRYDRALRQPCTWHLNATGDGIEARVRVASGPDVPIVVRLRFRGGKEPGRYHCRPLDESSFHVEHGLYDARLPRLELVLIEAPVETAAVLRGL